MKTLTNRPTRRTALGLIGATLAAPAAAFSEGVETLSGAAFGTRWRIAAPQGAGLGRLARPIEALFAAVDRRFSPWRQDSEISAFNARPGGTAPAHPDLVGVTAAALDIARRSKGAFDPTVGPLVARWGFGPIARGAAPDWSGVRTGPASLTKSRPDLTLDLCGIAKGWALDKAIDLVRAQGVEDLLFELGGEFAVLGQHPSGRAWRVAVEAPEPGQAPPVALRMPSGMAVATSGTRAQSYVLNGHRYGHIIDPGARAPVSGALRSVTVAASGAMEADGWATALFAAGEFAGPELARSEDIAALFLIETDGRLHQLASRTMSELIL